MSDNIVAVKIYATSTTSGADTQDSLPHAAISQFISSQSESYFWHKEKPKLIANCQPTSDASSSVIMPNQFITSKESLSIPSALNHLTITTNVGDCIDDEWFIVYLMIQLSIQFSSLIMTITDSDGEFLLIEASDHLPLWVNPECMDNRLFIYKGDLHLIPYPETPAQIGIYPSGKLSLLRALEIIADPKINTLSTSALQEAAFHKIEAYPEQALQNIHRAKCYLSPEILHILHTDPQLITQAIDCFVCRDAEDMKSAAHLETFKPTKTYLSTIKFTKMSFAQLLTQTFHAPKKYAMPLSDDPFFLQHELGMKLTCAFEMLFHNLNYTTLAHQSKSLLTTSTYPFVTDAQWQKYESRLEALGYFKGELKGSQLYSRLLEDAKKKYVEDLREANNDENPQQRLVKTMRGKKLELGMMVCDEQEDSLEWMNVQEDDFDVGKEQNVTEHDFGLGGEGELDPQDLEELENLSKIVNGFKQFVDVESGIDGVRFNEEEEIKKVGVELDVDAFMDTLFEVLGISKEELGLSSDNTLVEEESEYEDSKEDNQFESMQEIMNAMDRELSKTHIGKDFRDPEDDDSKQNQNISEEEEPQIKPVNLNINLIRNVLASLEAQQGSPGPMRSIIQSLGAKVPRTKA